MGLRLLTGHDGFDFITGGLPVEGILNIWGKPSTGKTSIARMIIREVSPFQSIIAYGLDSSLFEQSGDYLQMREPDYEKGLEACLDYLSAGHIVVIDELSVILANSPVAGAPGRLIAHFLSEAKTAMSGSGGCLIITSQVRKDGGQYAYRRSVQEYVDTEVRLKQKEAISDPLGDRIGRWVLLHVAKNRELHPNVKGRILIRVQRKQHGLTSIDGLIDGGFLRGEVHIEGSWWKFMGVKAQGRENLYQALQEKFKPPRGS